MNGEQRSSSIIMVNDGGWQCNNGNQMHIAKAFKRNKKNEKFIVIAAATHLSDTMNRVCVCVCMRVSGCRHAFFTHRVPNDRARARNSLDARFSFRITFASYRFSVFEFETILSLSRIVLRTKCNKVTRVRLWMWAHDDIVGCFSKHLCSQTHTHNKGSQYINNNMQFRASVDDAAVVQIPYSVFWETHLQMETNLTNVCM